MSTGSVNQPGSPSGQIKGVTSQSLTQIAAIVAVVLGLVFGLQYVAAHLRIQWVSPAAPAKPDKPHRSFPTSMVGGEAAHVG